MKRVFIQFLVIFIAGCGTSTVTEEQTTPDPYADPPGYSGNPFTGFGEVTTIAFPAESSAVQGVDEVVPAGSWSVQVAACSSMDAALSIRDQVEALTSQPVFIDRIGVYFKVRAGAFATREDSSGLRSFLRSSGFQDAWSVHREVVN